MRWGLLAQGCSAGSAALFTHARCMCANTGAAPALPQVLIPAKSWHSLLVADEASTASTAEQ